MQHQRSIMWARPVFWVNTMPHTAMKRGMPPLRHSPHPAMLDRIVVKVIHMLPVVILVTQQMFPITALPDTPLASALTYVASIFRTRDGERKSSLDDLPSQCKVVIAGRQFKD